jgi:hypothetical protein
MTTTWDSQNTAMEMRDLIATIADTRINLLRPEASYAVIQTINREARAATVLYMGDTDPVVVALGSIEPAVVGQTVRVGGTLGHRYVEDVLGNAIMSGNDNRYAQIGHTHAGGGAVELEMNDLADVDTETNPPGPDTVLGWNDIGGYWQPISFDLGTEFLPLTGGTVVGPTTFSAAVAMGATLNVSGALTAGTLAGSGAGITNLSANALQSGTIPVSRLPVTIGSDTLGTAAAWTTARLLTMTGDVSGTVSIKGNADMFMSVALQPNSIDLGTDTTGNYVQHIIGTANQIISNTVVATEGAIHTLSLPQSINITATPQFSRITFGQATGTAPMVVTSTTRVDNLTAHYLGAVNQDDAYFRNAGNLNAGTVPGARLNGAYTGITAVGTLSTLSVTGVAALGSNSTVAGQTIWHAGNDGAGSGLDAGLLGGILPIGYASTDIVETLIGDLLAVGLYDAAAYNGDRFSIIFDRALHHQITGLTVAAGDTPLDFRFAVDLPTIPQVDLAINAGRRFLLRTAGTPQVYLSRTGDDDHLLRATSAVSTAHDNNLILPSVFTIRTRVRKTVLNSATERIIARHGSDPGNLAWKLAILNGALIFTASSDGTTLTSLTVLTAAELDAISGTGNDTDFYVAVAITRNGTNLLARGWGSVDGKAWTVAAIPRSTPYAFTTFFNPQTPLWVGGEAAATAWDGRIYWVDVLSDSDPNHLGTDVFRFDAADHPLGTTTSYVDPMARTWTVSNAAAFVHATYNVTAIVPLSSGDRTVVSPAFSYTYGRGRPWHIRLTWNPTTDTLAIGHRNGESLELDVAVPAFTETATVFSVSTLSTFGAVTIGEATGPSAVNWSFGGRARRFLFSKNAATILDLRNTNINVMGQTVVTPTTGPAMTFSGNTMAMTTMPKPVWVEGPTVYRHNMYWIVASSAELDFIDSDLSGRYEIGIDNVISVANGDWIIGIDPLFGAPGHEEGANLILQDLVFQYIPFSTETFVKTQLHAHTSDTFDPHSAAGYLKSVTANSLYAPLVHTHSAEIAAHIDIHKSESDPHPQYLTQGEGDGLYLKPKDIQPYEPLGAVLAHEQKPDPHPVYVSHAEGNATFAVVEHGHIEYAQAGHTHLTDFEVFATDGAQSARLFIGSDTPFAPLVGDLWIQTFDISLQPPRAPVNLTVLAPTPSTITLAWSPWDASVIQTGVQMERSPNGSTGWTQIFSDNSAPYATSFTDVGRAERTTYWYRVRAISVTGNGAWGTVSATSGNAPPAAPGGLFINNATGSAFRLNWSAVTGSASDPMHAIPYEVFRSGVSQGVTANTYWDFTGLSERTSFSVGVRARDNTGLFSGVTSTTGSTTNDYPPAPTGLYSSGATTYSVTLDWAPVTGITDFSRYQVFLNGAYVQDVYTTGFVFYNVVAGQTYTVGVRSVDTSEYPSPISSINVSTGSSWDYTPNQPVTITSFRPEDYYGHMVIRWNQPDPSATTFLYRSINGGNWEIIYGAGLPAGNGFAWAVGDFGVDNTISIMIYQYDASSNVTYNPPVSYTLVPTPSYFSPHSSNSWRPTNGGQWGAQGTNKLYQGYYDTTAYNSYGFWFYGTDFTDWWRTGRTIVSAYIYVAREGCGTNQQDVIGLYDHQILENPGNVSNYGTPDLFGGLDAGTVAYNESKWMAIPTSWMYDTVAGYRRGFAVARPGSGKPYVCLHPAGIGSSGLVGIHHYG